MQKQEYCYSTAVRIETLSCNICITARCTWYNTRLSAIPAAGIVLSYIIGGGEALGHV